MILTESYARRMPQNTDRILNSAWWVSGRCRSFVIGWLLLLVVFAGCRSFDLYDPTDAMTTPPELEPPREMSMRSLPAYRIEPPDILQVEVLKMVPLPPYRVEEYDVLAINVLGTLMDQPISNYFLVEAEGNINLGPAYGKLRVVGMTIPEVKAAIENHLRKFLRQPEVAVQLARASGVMPVTGTYLVGPDGTINLRQHGAVHVAGMTVAEAKVAIERHLSHFLDSPEVSVDVAAYNSKTYYIIVEGAGMGETVVRLPVTGNENVLDAISQIQGLTRLSSKRIWIARPSPGGFGCEQVLPIDWDAIVQGASTETNYQVLPGDRIFIAEDPMIAFTSLVGKITSPFEQVLGFGSLTASTVRNWKSIDVPLAR